MMKIVRCKSCGKDIYRLTRDLKLLMGDYVRASDFRGINGFKDPVDGDRMVCPNCQVSLFHIELLVRDEDAAH